MLLKQVSFDWRRDLKVVAPMAEVDLFMYTSVKRELRSIQDVVIFAKGNPGTLNFGVVGLGSVSHLSVERFMAQKGIRMTLINYNGIAQRVPALLNGEIDVFVLAPRRSPVTWPRAACA